MTRPSGKTKPEGVGLKAIRRRLQSGDRSYRGREEQVLRGQEEYETDNVECFLMFIFLQLTLYLKVARYI